MSSVTVSMRYFQEEIERKAYAYGVSPVVAFLLGEHAANILREISQEQAAAKTRPAVAA